jgi:hypothetical protein
MEQPKTCVAFSDAVEKTAWGEKNPDRIAVRSQERRSFYNLKFDPKLWRVYWSKTLVNVLCYLKELATG